MVKKVIYNHGGSGMGYFLGFLGALIFELQHAVGLSEVLLGILKSIVWPALLTFRFFEYFRI
jgi:hypothetical protein